MERTGKRPAFANATARQAYKDPSRTAVAAKEAVSECGQRASFNLGEREILPR